MVGMGYNISLGNLGHRYDEAMRNARDSGADFHLVMTNPHGGVNGAGEINEIQRWKDAMPDGTRLLWRTFLATNGEWVRTLGFNLVSEMMALSEADFRAHCIRWAQGQAQQWAREGHQDVIRDDPDNEPKLSGASDDVVRRYVISREELVKACKAVGITVAVGAFSVGLPHEGWIDRGLFDPLLKIAEVFSVHEYPPAMVGVGDVLPYEAMFEPETLWAKLPKQVWAISTIYSLMRRCDHLKLRAELVGNPNLEFIISETSTNEDIPDAHRVTSQLRGVYGKPECGGDLRGVQAWTRYHERVFGSNDVNQNVAQMIEYMLKYIYSVKHVIGVCFFALNYKWGEGAEGENRCHNLLNEMFDYLRRVLIPDINKRIREADVVTDIPKLPEGFDWDMRPASVSSAGVKVRSSWSTQDEANVLFVLREEQTVQASKNSFHNPNNGWDWLRVIFKDTVVGYVAKPFVNVSYVPVVDTPPTTEPPVVDPAELEAAVFKWLDENADRLFAEAVVEKSDTLIDKLVKVIFREWSTHIPVQEQPDMPAPLMAFISRFFGFIAKVSAPPTD